MDFAIHDTDSGNPHCHIMLTMRPLDERGAWAAKSKKEYDLDENGERIRLPSGRYKTHKVDPVSYTHLDSVRQYGVLVPAIARPDPEGGYELVAGHRRHRASELAEKETMPVSYTHLARSG